MDNKAEVREFLTSRRAKLSPSDVGLPDVGQRRVPGLRRGEIAALAGVSVEYYARLERGAIAGASSPVLEAIATALRLNDTERAHLLDLARAADGIPTSGRQRRRAAAQTASRPSLHWALAAITEGVAFVRNPRQDLLATNALGRVFYSPLIGDGGRTPNLARSSSSTPPRGTSTPTGTRSRTCASPSCAPKPDATRTTVACRTWSASSPPRARPSAALGRTRRPHPRDRHQTVQPSRRRRAHPGLRRARHHRRTRPHPHPLHRRTRLPIRRKTPAPRLPGS